MPTSVRPFRTTGAALAAVAVLTTAAPAVLTGHATDLPAITRAYDLTGASDISGQAAGVVFLAGWGDFIGPDDPYFPGQFNNDLRLDGPLGVAYYMIDTSMNSAVTKDLENYIFELAARESDPFQAVQAAVRAAAYVAVASNLGVDSVPAKLAKSLVYGVPFDLPGAIVQLTAPIPLAGDIISVYFTGRAEGDPAVYGTGLAGLIAYSGTLLPWIKPLLGPAGEPRQAAAADAGAQNLADAGAGQATDAISTPGVTAGSSAADIQSGAEALEQGSPVGPAEADVPAVASPVASAESALDTGAARADGADPADLAAPTEDSDVTAEPAIAVHDSGSDTAERRGDRQVRRGGPAT